ncbi:MAG: penicillin acylase family protein [Bacteroidota bacterium]
MRCFVLSILSLLVFASCGVTDETDLEVQRWKAQAERVTIMRDDFGVPHIYGKTDADAVFGLLYAQCEDDFNRVEQNYIWATGRLAEVEGKEALYSDLRANLFMTETEAKANYEASPEWLKKLCDAFADGINYYLYTHPEVTPGLLTRFEPWMPMYFSEGSIGGDIERVSLKKIKAFYERGMPRDVHQSLIEPVPSNKKREVMEEPQGSNGIAISGELTESGNTLLLINPHTSFYFRAEVHMVSEEGLNAYGAVTWGQFFVYQGFNEKTGWMHTSTYTDVMDEFVEKTVTIPDDDSIFYQYGEELRPMEHDEITLKYKEGETIKEQVFSRYGTHHGPITHAVNWQWTASAMMWEPAKALEQSFIRTKQKGYAGFRKMMDMRTNSSNNTVYADAEGNIAYFHGNFIPQRDTLFDYSKPVDGSLPQTDWQGLHTVDENILIKNPKNGWIQNCNSTPYTAALDFGPERGAYPRYMSLDRENFRGIHAITLLKDKEGHTLEGLIQLAHDPYLPAFAALIPGLVEAYGQAKAPASLKGPIEILKNWDFNTSKASSAMTLAHYYGSILLKKAERPIGLSVMALMQYWGSPLFSQKTKLTLFEESVEQLKSDFGSWDIPWGQVNRYQRLNGDIFQAFDDTKPSIPIGFASGKWGALAAYGMYYDANTRKMYGSRGNSFAAVVEFGDKVKAKSILVGGQSGNPDSPHFNDQVQRYVEMHWKEVPYYKEDVLKRAKKTYSPGEAW